MSLHLTPAAAREILAAAGRSGAGGSPLRVAARPTPGGIAFTMGFDDAKPDDVVAVVEGLTVLVGPDSRDWVVGAMLDFVELDDGSRDFIFVQPRQEQAGAGCGSGCGGGSCSSCG
jgi:iron-sulfur cluster assembly protein